MKVRDVASSAVVAVGPAPSLREAAQLMAKHGVGAAVVQDAEMRVGFLTERDVLTAVAAADTPEAVNVEQLMPPDVVPVAPDGDLFEAAKVMANRRIRHLVVYDGGQ